VATAILAFAMLLLANHIHILSHRPCSIFAHPLRLFRHYKDALDEGSTDIEIHVKGMGFCAHSIDEGALASNKLF